MARRLSTVAVGLVEQLEQWPPAKLRKAASAAALFAAERVGIDDPRLGPLLEILRSGVAGDPAGHDIAALITEELDEMAWDVQDKVDEGLIPEQAYLDAFSRARAVAAVGSALEADPLEAALESVYEAQAAVGGVAAIRMMIQDL